MFWAKKEGIAWNLIKKAEWRARRGDRMTWTHPVAGGTAEHAYWGSNMFWRSFVLAASCVVLVACQTMESPPLDEYPETTANGVRFRALSGINDTCDTAFYSDPVGWGGFHVTVEQAGKIRRNPKFNFALPGQQFNNPALGASVVLTELFAREYGSACYQWQLAPEADKPVYLSYFREAITLTFEAATRFEAAGRIGPDALRPEYELMRDKFDKLVAHKPKHLVKSSQQSGG